MMEIFVLLVLFQIKHWLADYPLQTQFMLKKFQREMWVFPLTYHAGVHAALTILLSVLYLGSKSVSLGGYFEVSLVLLLGMLDFSVHFVVDRVKAHPDIGGKYKMDNPKFWWTLGADQMMHHLTHYLIIFIIMNNI